MLKIRARLSTDFALRRKPRFPAGQNEHGGRQAEHGGSPKHIGFAAEDYSSGGARKLHFIRSHGGDIIASADSVSGKRLCKSILTGKIRRVKAL